MAFNVGDNVWFKKAGRTPFVTGSSTDAATEVGNNLGGRGKADITTAQTAGSAGGMSFSEEAGMPRIKTADFPTALTSTDTTAGTFPSTQDLGVKEASINNPMAPKGYAVGGTAATILGSTAETYDVSAGKTLIVTVDKGSAQTITLAADGGNTALTVSQLVTLINAETFTGFVVTVDGTKIRITSSTTGSKSHLKIGAGTINNIVGLTTNATASGANFGVNTNLRTDGQFDGPTPSALFNPGSNGSLLIDEGQTGGTNTIQTYDPNRIGGQTMVASGTNVKIDGLNDNQYEVIDIKTATKVVGKRTPSSTEGSGEVIDIITVKADSYSPDGTFVKAGTKMYYVNWGTSSVSNPRRARWYNRFRVSLHAEVDLVSAA